MTCRQSDHMAARPLAISDWLAHTVTGVSIRGRAKVLRVHPSTVLRRVRSVEDLTDCPAWGEILDRAAAAVRAESPDGVRLLSAAYPDRLVALMSAGASQGDIVARLQGVSSFVLASGGFLAWTPGATTALAVGPHGQAPLPVHVGLSGFVCDFLMIASGTTPGLVRARLTPTGRAAVTGQVTDGVNLHRRLAQLSGFTRWSNDADRIARRVAYDLQTDRAGALERFGKVLPPDLLDIVEDMLVRCEPAERVEARHALPQRSAKAMLAAALSTLDHAGP